MFLTYFLFILGFASLVKGADWLIEGAVALARKFHVSEIAIGLTVVAFGTSAPELVVNVVSSIRASGELSLDDWFTKIVEAEVRFWDMAWERAA